MNLVKGKHDASIVEQRRLKPMSAVVRDGIVGKIADVIPGNDDAIRAIQLYAGSMADAILEGKEYAALQGGNRGAEPEAAEAAPETTA